MGNREPNQIRPVRDESPLKRVTRAGLGQLPFAVGIAGPARDRLLGLMDRLFPADHRGELERITTVDGRRFELALDSPNQRLMSYLYGNLVRHYRRTDFYAVLQTYWETAAAKDLSRPPVFVDVGANLGIYCLLAGELGFETVAVEAEPVHSAFLERHGDLFGTVCAVAAGDVAGAADFFVALENPGASSLVFEKNDVASSSIYEERVQVSVKRLDELFNTLPHDPSAIELLKIDVEGHEESVVRGLSGFFDAGHRPAIWCEVRGPQSGRAPSSHREVAEFLATYGYRPYRFDKTPRPFDADSDVPQVFDLLFTTP